METFIIVTIIVFVLLMIALFVGLVVRASWGVGQRVGHWSQGIPPKPGPGYRLERKRGEAPRWVKKGR